MQEAVPLGAGTMAAIIGLSSDDVKECCRKASEYGIVEPANFNCPGQITIAGEIKAVDKAMELCTEKGAKRAVKLAVSAPFHCSMLKSAGEKLALELEKVEFQEIKIPVVSNVTAKAVDSTDEAKELLIRQVSSPVLWEESVRYMLDQGVDTFIEIGPGKVLGGFVKKICKEARIYNIEDLNSLEKTLGEITI